VRTAVVGLAAVAALTLAACGSKSAETTTTSAAATGSAAASGSASAGGAGGALAIVPVEQIDKSGKKVEVAAGGTPASPAGDGTATCSGVNLAMAGSLTGPNSPALGQNILKGAQLAIKEHNDANANCQVELKPFDTEGDPQKATGVAPNIVSDASVIGLLGPAFSGETQATGDIFFQAGLLSVTASATAVNLTENGWTNFFRGLGNDGLQGPSVGNYMVSEGYSHICIVNDEQAYSVGLAQEIRGALGTNEDASCATEVKSAGSDYSSVVTAVKGASDADAIFYAGYYPEAAKIVKQLRDGGVTLPFISADGTNDPQFVAQAGESSKGAILSCPCGPAPAQFAADYQALNNVAPGVYSVEAYDLTTIMLKGIDSGITDRAGMINYVKNYKGDGLARAYQWNDKGELASALIWIYKVQ